MGIAGCKEQKNIYRSHGSPFKKGCAFPFELEELQITVCLRRCGSYGSFSSKIREVEQTGSDYRWMKSDHTEGRQ